jgi:S-methyl-5-thioribose-1-phosphate isomerase
VEWGTALGVVQALHERGVLGHVYVDETRPLLQGSRLTTWELAQQGIPHTLVADAAGPSVIARGLVNAVIVGADRIAANGDVVNKIGTYPLALAARRAGIPFVVAAPESTVDAATPTGADVPIEVRDDAELTRLGDQQISPRDTPALNYAFDVTPADLVTAIVTETRVLT